MSPRRGHRWPRQACPRAQPTRPAPTGCAGGRHGVAARRSLLSMCDLPRVKVEAICDPNPEAIKIARRHRGPSATRSPTSTATPVATATLAREDIDR